jgi:CheY-like chemotaxis protein
VTRALKQGDVDVETALKMMKQNLYTMVVMDVQMPVMDGIESVRQLREWERSEEGDGGHQYIISASASPDEITRGNCFSAGTDTFMLKPLVFSELLSCIKSQHCAL